MSRMLVLSLALSLVVILLLLPQVGLAQFYFEEPPPETEFGGRLDLDFSSQYVWRGVEYNSEAVFQPALRINERGFELAVRGNMDLTDANDYQGDFTEWNYRVGFARRGPTADFAFTYNYYDYPKGDRSKTQELALEMAWGYPAIMGMDFYWDCDQADGFYWKSSLGYIWEIGILRVVPEAAIGFATKKYQRYYFDISRDSFVDFEASLKLELEFISGISLRAEGSYYELVRSELREWQKDQMRGEHFWGSGGLIFRF